MPRPHSGKQVRLTEAQREEIRALYRQGVPYEEIVRQYGCSLSNFWLIVRGIRHEVIQERFEADLSRLATLDPAKLGWVAGIVDGEGYIGVVANRSRGYLALMPRVDISSTTREMQDALRSILGFGLVYEKKKRAHRPNERLQFCWAIWSAPCVGSFLKAIEPYLVVKRRVAKVVRHFCESRLRNDLQPYTTAELAVLDQVRKLNARGTQGFISRGAAA